MKVMFIARTFNNKNGASVLTDIHYNAIKKIVGDENLFTIDLSPGDPLKKLNYIAYGKAKNKLQKIWRGLEGNTEYISNKIIDDILNIIILNKIDVVFIDDSIFGRLTMLIKKKTPKVKVIAFYHDIKRDLYRQRLKEEGIRVLHQYRTITRNEYLNQKYADLNITLNERESKSFKKFYNKSSNFEMPIFVKHPSQLNNRLLQTSPDKCHLLFVGTFYKPNQEGIRWFCREVFPHLDEIFELWIVGMGLEILRDELETSRIKVFGTVDSLELYYRSSDIVVAPIFSGAGMKVKTAEAFSYGKCFVGSSESLEGYWENIPEICKNKNIFLCDEAVDYINIINGLGKNNVLKECKEIYDLYWSKYSEEAAISNLSAVLNMVI